MDVHHLPWERFSLLITIENEFLKGYFCYVAMNTTACSKKDDIMATQGINVSMAYVEKSSAKAGTELALQVRVKMIWSKARDI